MTNFVIGLIIILMNHFVMNIYIQQTTLHKMLNTIRNDIQNMKANITNEIISNRLSLC